MFKVMLGFLKEITGWGICVGIKSPIDLNPVGLGWFGSLVPQLQQSVYPNQAAVLDDIRFECNLLHEGIILDKNSRGFILLLAIWEFEGSLFS